MGKMCLNVIIYRDDVVHFSNSNKFILAFRTSLYETELN